MKKIFHCIKLFFSLNSTKNCIEYLTSKIFKFIIILTSIISKLPQIYYMMNENNILSLNYISIYFEIIYYVFRILYPYINNNNIFTYLECIFVLMELIIVFLLNWKYSQDQNSDRNNFFFSSFLIIFIYLNFKIEFMSKDQLKKIYIFSTLLLIISRIKQIFEIFNEKNSGPLSSFTFICHSIEFVFEMILNFKEIEMNKIEVFEIVFYLLVLVLNFLIVFLIIFYSYFFKKVQKENYNNNNNEKKNKSDDKNNNNENKKEKKSKKKEKTN